MYICKSQKALSMNRWTDEEIVAQQNATQQ